MVVDESNWSTSTAQPSAADLSVLQKLEEVEKEQKQKEISDNRAQRQSRLEKLTLFNPSAAPTTKIGKAPRRKTKKEKEKRVKAALKAEEFTEQLQTKASKSAQKQVRDRVLHLASPIPLTLTLIG